VNLFHVEQRRISAEMRGDAAAMQAQLGEMLARGDADMAMGE
jgi:hypothetical protein